LTFPPGHQEDSASEEVVGVQDWGAGRRRLFSSRLQLIVYLSLTAILLCSRTVRAQSCETPAATVTSVQGTVEAKRVGDAQWQPVHLHNTYCPGDEIRVQDRSRADVTLANESVLRLNANTAMTFEATEEKQSSLVSLFKGAAHFFSRRPRSLEVRTPFTVAGVRGTEFYISVEDDKTLLSVFTGQVVASNEAGSLALTSGQSAVAERDKAPVLRMVARPRDAVQWALYYPPVIYAQSDKLKAGVDWERQVGTSMASYLQGDIQKAFDAIASVPDTVREPGFFTYRASLLLAVGQADEANADIERALNLNPNDSDALALQTIIAVVQNDKDKALSVAQKAVEAAPDSATAQIALSYAQQARFDLEGARASLEKAVQLDPANALAWARLAELHASFGHLDKALKAAKQAVVLEPNLARTQTVLGFAYLTQAETEKARAAFEKAIALDQADPLPRSGMGLAIIRDGNVTAGSRELEIAASLDPNNSLIRSYLGKAYYEEKRGELDEREFDIAKQLDPNDPTPWFYSAIAKQTTNRPVEALRDMQKAIELNDNRAVYRSKLLLDSDLAARSASQARIYSDLGFQQLALVEGWKSVNTDPTNYSAHRFLADSYSALPRHEIARVSELLQSQLLQSINMTPIQPRLAESNLFLISTGGPGALSFTEFSPLFNRNGVTVQASGLVGENDTLAGEGVISGIAGTASFSVGYSHFETDGFRQNADQEDDIFNTFVQVELSPKTSIQAEFRHRDTEFGDLRLKFFPGSIFPTQRNTSESDTLRLGARHAFSPGSVLLSSFIYQHSNFRERHEPFPQPGVLLVDFDQPDQQAVSGELQYLFHSRYINLTSGGGYFDVADELEQLVRFGPPFPGTPPTRDVPGTTGLDLQHGNVYTYSHINLLKNVTFTVGVSYDHVDSEFLNEVKDQFNPKFGIVWNPFPHTTIRAAVFRVLKRTLITQQTLEPTQVAGFNQFFDDGDLTESWRYGVAIDQKFTTNIFGGVEFSKRKLKVPFLDFTVNPQSPPTRDADWDEYLARVYLLLTPHRWLTLRTEYIFERWEREDQFPSGVIEADTHRVPIGINFFHPSGLSAMLTATYFNQDGEFGGFFATDPIRRGSDDFWTVDMAINYRLPKRYGFVSVGVSNLFDEDFQFFDLDLNNASIQPVRMAFGRVTLALP
jgi:tetratricopeptide (TPR) repeat protein